MTHQKQLAEALNWIPHDLALPLEPSAEAIPADLPPAYLEFLALIQPGEGFIGHRYLRLFALEQLPWVNTAYEVRTYLPGFFLFGSDGCGEAYLFGPASPARSVVTVPFIPLDLEYQSESWPSFDHFLVALAEAPPDCDSSTYPDTPDPKALGLEVHQVHPIVFGGHPTDPANTVLVPVEKHVELVSFWNRTYQGIRQRAGA